MSTAETSPATRTVATLIAEWQEARLELRALDEAEHPDITDVLGRAWAWIDKDLYRHDDMAWPLEFITAERMGLPTKDALDNPNYQWCSICRGEQA